MMGLVGAHRTGKTTLARVVAERTGLPFVSSSTSQVFADMGLDVRDDYPFSVRIRAQHIVLERMIEAYRRAGTRFITDRTPIDALAYTLADVQKANLTVGELKQVETYMEECIRATNYSFFHLFLLPTGLPYVEAPGKPPFNVPYQEHIHFLAFGAVVDERFDVTCEVLRRAATNLDSRADHVCEVYENSAKEARKAIKGLTVN